MTPTYRISSSNSRPSINRLPYKTILNNGLPRITPQPNPYPNTSYRRESEVESDPAKQISDDTSSDAEDIDIEKQNH